MATLSLGRGFPLPENYVTKTAAILAKKRIGKTYNASVIAEEFVAAGIPFVALDPTSAWWGLRAAADGVRAGLPVVVIGGDHGDIPIDVHAGRAIADLVVEEPGFYILDLGHWESDSEHRRFAAPFLDRLYRHKAKHRDPLHLFVDEADVFAPQKPQKGDEQMLHNMQAIVRRGGIRGLGTTLITQRAAVLNKDVLTQLDILFILRTIAPQDQDAVEDYVKRGAAGDRAEIMASLASLAPGEAWVYGPGEEPPLVKRVQFRKRKTFNSSATPTGERAPEPRKLADVDLERVRGRLAEQIEKAKENDPNELKRRLAEADSRLEKAMANSRSEGYREGFDAARREVTIERVEVPTLDEGELESMQKALDELRSAVTEISGTAGELGSTIEFALQLRKDAQNGSTPVISEPAGVVAVKQLVTPAPVVRSAPAIAPRSPDDLGSPSALELEMLNVFAAHPSQVVAPARLGVTLAKSSNSGPFRKAIRALIDRGWIAGDEITEEGMEACGETVYPPTPAEVQERWRKRLKGDNVLMQQVFEVVLEHAPAAITPEQIGEAIGKSPNSGPVRKAFKQLDSLQVCVYDRSAGTVTASPYLLNP